MTVTAYRVALPSRIPPPAFGRPEVLRAVLLSGAAIALAGLFGLGLVGMTRHSAAAPMAYAGSVAAPAAYAGSVFVVGRLLLAVAPSAVRYVPPALVSDSPGVTRPSPLSPWTGLGLLCRYAAAALGAGAWVLARRDA